MYCCVIQRSENRIKSGRIFYGRLWLKQDCFADDGEITSEIDAAKGKVKLSPYRPWRPLGLREVEAPTFSDIRLIDSGKVVSPTRRPLFTPRKIPGTHFC
jgi:hypothetical protein